MRRPRKFPIDSAAVRRARRQASAAADRLARVEADAWRSCFGDRATGSKRTREARALHIASTCAVLKFLEER